MRTVFLGLTVFAVTMTGACSAPYESDPVSVYQWERRQNEIERQDAAKQRLCQTLDKQSARYERECAGVRS